MNQFNNETPVVMSLSSHDPSGNAGIQADIETVASLGCHCTPVITALCAKDTQALRDIAPTDTSLVISQARAILEDMPVKAIKLGLMASVENVEAIHTILSDYPQIPVVVSPVIAEYNNELYNAKAILRATKTLLMPRATVATPDVVEAFELAQSADTADACAFEILETGCQYVLVSGSSRNQHHYENTLYADRRILRQYKWPRLKLVSHGAGATLSASIAAYLAHGSRVEDAVEQAQQFTWRALSASRRLGMGHQTPNRMHWADRNETSTEKQKVS
ncbi:bifunctional hydroxymethylpyrimidine kinase/phosphomethylpyrimidine kinase [Aurantivibrio plasticivorans]